VTESLATNRLQSTGAYALELDGVARHFGALVALSGINMRIAAGERRAVLGSNGAGKTTLFNAVTGDFMPTAGRIRFFRPGEGVAAAEAAGVYPAGQAVALPSTACSFHWILGGCALSDHCSSQVVMSSGGPFIYVLFYAGLINVPAAVLNETGVLGIRTTSTKACQSVRPLLAWLADG